MGALSFPTPFFIYFFMWGFDPNGFSAKDKFLLIFTLLLSGAVIGLAFYYKDSAMAALRDWYPPD